MRKIETYFRFVTSADTLGITDASMIVLYGQQSDADQLRDLTIDLLHADSIITRYCGIGIDFDHRNIW